MKTVDHLVLLSDTSAKGLNVANSIAHVARDNKAVGYTDMGLILNRVMGGHEVEDIRTRTDLDIYGWIGEDETIRDFDFKGTPLTGIPDTSPTLAVIARVLTKMGVLP
jgi:CO dehydrogenase nickel-insertion accessory protein CooC1